MRPSGSITQIIAELERQVAELKEVQIVGSDAVLTRKLGTTAQWDRDVQIPDKSAGGTEQTESFIIRYVPTNPVADKPPAAFKVVVGNEITSTAPYATDMQPPWNIKRRKVTNPNIQEWSVNVRYYPFVGYATRYKLKFYVLATGAGTVSII